MVPPVGGVGLTCHEKIWKETKKKEIMGQSKDDRPNMFCPLFLHEDRDRKGVWAHSFDEKSMKLYPRMLALDLLSDLQLNLLNWAC